MYAVLKKLSSEMDGDHSVAGRIMRQNVETNEIVSLEERPPTSGTLVMMALLFRIFFFARIAKASGSGLSNELHAH
jgi:hypothetical protein